MIAIAKGQNRGKAWMFAKGKHIHPVERCGFGSKIKKKQNKFVSWDTLAAATLLPHSHGVSAPCLLPIQVQSTQNANIFKVQASAECAFVS